MERGSGFPERILQDFLFFFPFCFLDIPGLNFILENIKVGMPVGIKGRIQNTPRTLANNFQLPVPQFIGERIFIFSDVLSNSTEEEKNED